MAAKTGFDPQRFYENMRRAQLFVTNEIAFCEIASAVREDSLNKAGKLFEMFCTRMKQHYITQMMLENPELRMTSDRQPVVMFKNVFHAVEKVVFQDVVFQEEKVSDFCNFCQDLPKDDVVIDVMTFSFIPSYFRFFLTRQALNNFETFLQGLVKRGAKDLYLKFARAAFVHPYFLLFVAETFREVLTPVFRSQGKRGILDMAELTEHVVGRMEQNKRLIPVCAKLVISEAPEAWRKEVLVKCFLEPFAKDPKQFMACNYFDRVFNGFLGQFVEHFKTTDQFTQCMALFVPGKKRIMEDSFGIIRGKGEAIDESEFDRTVYGTADDQLIKALQKKKKGSFSCKKEAMNLFRVFGLTESQGPEVFQATMVPDGQQKLVAYNLREMMKKAPLLPANERVEDFKDPLAIVEEYLVRHVPLEIMAQQYHYFAEAREYIQPGKTEFMDDGFFDDFLIEHDVKKFVEAFNFNTEIRSIYQRSDAAVTHSMQYLQMIIIKSLVFNIDDNVQDDPCLFRKTVLSLIDKFSSFVNQNFHGVMDKSIYYHIVAEKLDYEKFLVAHMDLASLDSAFAMHLKKSDPSQGATGHVGQLLARENLRELDPWVKRLVDWTLENDNPLSKLFTFYDIFIGLSTVLVHAKDSSDAEPAAADDYIPMLIGTVMYAAPPKLMSCLSYMMDFLIAENGILPTLEKCGVIPVTHSQCSTTLRAVVLGLFPGCGFPPSTFITSSKVSRKMCVVGQGKRAIATLMGLTGINSPSSFEGCETLLVHRHMSHANFVFETTFSRTTIPSGDWDAIIYCYEPTEASHIGSIIKQFDRYANNTSMFSIILCTADEKKAIEDGITKRLKNPSTDMFLLDSVNAPSVLQLNQASKKAPIVPLAMDHFHTPRRIAEKLWKRLDSLQ